VGILRRGNCRPWSRRASINKEGGNKKLCRETYSSFLDRKKGKFEVSPVEKKGATGLGP